MRRATAVAVRAASLVLVWAALVEGRAYLWPAGVVAVSAALAASAALAPPGGGPRLRLRGVPGFAVAFLVGSLRGGADVALRALGRRARIEPVLLDHRLELPPGAPRHLFAAVVSLLPGTLAVRVADDVVTIHVLHPELRPEETLAALEQRVAALFAPAGRGAA